MSILYNPWQVGDVYAYYFKKHHSKQQGLFGKCILLQKLADEPWCNDITLSRLQVYDAIFDSPPQNLILNDFRILPLDLPDRFFSFDENLINPSLDLNLLMVIYKKNDYPFKNLVYLGNFPNPYHYPYANPNSSAHNWFDIEKWFVYYHQLWKDIDYSIIDNSVILRRNKKV